MPNNPPTQVVKFKASDSAYDETLTSKNNSRDQEMIEQTALVTSVEAGYAWVVPQQKTTNCGSCTSNKACIDPKEFGFKSKHQSKMRVLNPLHARTGETVVVGVQGQALMLYSVLAYIVPLFALVIFAVLGKEVFTYFNLTSEVGAILGGVAGLIGSLYFVNEWSARSLVSDKFQPVILRVQGRVHYPIHPTRLATH